MDIELLKNIRKLSNEINDLTIKIEKINENNRAEKKNEIENEILKKKYIILKLSSKSILNHDNNNEKVAGMPSDNKFNNSIIKWKNSLRNPYFH